MIIPSIDIQNGRAVQLRRGKDFILDGGDPMKRLESFRLAGEVAVIDLDAAMGVGNNRDLIRKMVRTAQIRVGGGIRTPDLAREWLNAGASRVIIGTEASPELLVNLPRERVIAAVDAVEGSVVTEGWTNRTGENVLGRIKRLAHLVDGFLLTQVEHEGGMAGFDWDLVEKAAVAARDARLTAAGGITSSEDIARLDAVGIDSQVGMALYSGAFTLGEAIAAPLSNPVMWPENDLSSTPVKGHFAAVRALWPTVVVEESGTTLGLVWSSLESLSRAVLNRKGVYFSRSRNEIWEKGATSGATQELLRIDLDCDRDALKFTVRQTDGFCHVGTRTCWGDIFDLVTLERTIAERIASGNSLSGTVKLTTSEGLLRSKLLEEAAELSDTGSPEEAAHEAADLMYFLLVSAVQKGASVSAVVDELARRNRRLSRRPMEAK
jgi:phosphoribosyl-ATP pyrophosphohydrolase